MNRIISSSVRRIPTITRVWRPEFLQQTCLFPMRSFSTETPKEAAKGSEDVTMTEDCANRIIKISKKKNKPLDQMHLRISVQSGGCSGLQYKFTMDYDPIYEYDKYNQGSSLTLREFIHSSGARIAVDTVSYDYIKGSIVDFEESLVRTGFVVSKNPNAADSCSCGTSFTAKSSNPYE